MAELPASWKLNTRKRADGKLDVMGETDAGDTYKVRTCESGAVTDADVQAIKECDREQYGSRDNGARAYVRNLLDTAAAFRANQEQRFEDELAEAAGPVVHAGLERKGATAGYSRRYAKNYDAVFGGDC